MAGASLLTLLDDIASVLDDIAVLSKVAAKRRPASWVMILLLMRSKFLVLRQKGRFLSFGLSPKGRFAINLS